MNRVKDLNIQYKNCVVFATTPEKARKKLDEIISSKSDNGIRIIKQFRTNMYGSVFFEDGEVWHAYLCSYTARGLRWHKAWIDKLLPSKWIIEVAMSMEMCGDSEYKWF